jgi:deoxyribonuclease V
LHPRRAGIASCFGVITGVPTIGVGKSLLCGKVNRSTSVDLSPEFAVRPVLDGDEWLADCVIRKRGSKPIYASIGHRVDRESIRKLLPRLFGGHRLPEPIYQADRLSKQLK